MRDNKNCTHGMTYNDPCDQCEMVALNESTRWMRERLEADEKRLTELQAKSK